MFKIAMTIIALAGVVFVGGYLGSLFMFFYYEIKESEAKRNDRERKA